MGININFTDEDWERIERDWSAWWAGELERPMVMIESLNLLFARDTQEFTREFMLDKPAEEVIDYYQKKLETVRYQGDSMPKWFPNFGPGVVAGFLGSKVMSTPDERTVWFEVDENPLIRDVHFEFDPENIWWKRIQDLTRTAVEKWGDRVSVGHTDLGGNLDIMASFRTSMNLLYEVIDSPEEVSRLVNEITSVWLRYYDELHETIKKARRGTSGWAEIWSPGRTYMHQCDFSYMISPEMFEKFVMPDLDACFSKMDHAFYHLDGKGQVPHVDMLLSMENLAGIQWIPGAGQPQPNKWMPLLKQIRDAGKLIQVYETPKGVRRIVKELGGKGFAFYIIMWPQMSQDEIEDFLREMASLT